VDARAQQAREHHKAAGRTDHEADEHRQQRDALVRMLRAEDPDYWTYVKLASAVGCSKELVAVIINPKKVVQT
jgi:hypothetical protein